MEKRGVEGGRIGAKWWAQGRGEDGRGREEIGNKEKRKVRDGEEKERKWEKEGKERRLEGRGGEGENNEKRIRHLKIDEKERGDFEKSKQTVKRFLNRYERKGRKRKQQSEPANTQYSSQHQSTTEKIWNTKKG